MRPGGKGSWGQTPTCEEAIGLTGEGQRRGGDINILSVNLDGERSGVDVVLAIGLRGGAPHPRQNNGLVNFDVAGGVTKKRTVDRDADSGLLGRCFLS